MIIDLSSDEILVAESDTHARYHYTTQGKTKEINNYF